MPRAPRTRSKPTTVPPTPLPNRASRRRAVKQEEENPVIKVLDLAQFQGLGAAEARMQGLMNQLQAEEQNYLKLLFVVGLTPGTLYDINPDTLEVRLKK